MSSSEPVSLGDGRAVRSLALLLPSLDRLIRRWRAGAPVALSPEVDDPSLGQDPSRNNNFLYDPSGQLACPFAAHTRKTNPRTDLSVSAIDPRRIIRHVIQFGPEVSASEAVSKTTTLQRGLLFVTYQSNISNGFQFIQESR
jgi:deferrochelatase/peroxidase EfeB